MARMIQACDVTEVEIVGRAFWVRPVSPGVLKSSHMGAAAWAESLDKPFAWAVGFGMSRPAAVDGYLLVICSTTYHD